MSSSRSLTADRAIGESADAKRTAAVKERELDIESYNAETDRLKVTGANADQIEQVTRDLINQMLMHPDPLPGDGEPLPTPPAPPAPVAPPEPPAAPPEPPAAPPPDNSQLIDAIAQLHELIKRPRERIPVRDKEGNIIKVVDSMP